MVIIDDDYIEEPEDSGAEELKQAIRNGLNDMKEIVSLLEKISPLIEPFGHNDTIKELIMLYDDFMPQLLLGNYDYILEGTEDIDRDVSEIIVKKQRKDIVANLLNK